MKRKIFSSILAFSLLFSSCMCNFITSTYADNGGYEILRYNDDTYNYRKTTDLECSFIENKTGDEILTLTWPAVDKSGNLINQNPLSSTSAIGNPTGSNTTVNSGMIIGYNGWNIAGNNSNPTQTIDGDTKIIYGLTKDKVTDYPVILADGTIAYLSDEVVADNFATAYLVESSEDGVNFVTDHVLSTVNHGKKLSRAVLDDNGNLTTKENGDGTTSYVNKNDGGTTFFLEDQLVEQFVNPLSPNTKYTIRVSAYPAIKVGNATDVDRSVQPFKVFETDVITPPDKDKTEAFPSVEGSGRYSQGGRGGDVYIVTNLTDSVSNPQKGSLRYGLERKDLTDKTSKRTIVFAVGGTIEVDPTASKSQRRLNVGSNTTIAGQTAPGNGITISGASFKVEGENIIVRYIRARLGDGYDQDATTVSGKNIVVDHCSFGWGVDETFSAKELINSSIQYNIIANGLAMVNKNGVNNTAAEIASGESEAKHGMGSLLNGYEASITHNLWAHNGTRNPRFEGSFSYQNITYTNKMDFSNNVVYNWGHNSAYGGERGAAQVNFTNNYYKAGLNTLAKVKSQFLDCDGGSAVSSYYVDGNYMEDNETVSSDNLQGFKDLSQAVILQNPVTLAITYNAESAQSAYKNILDSVGASYVRDAHDNRLITEVKNGTGTFVNSDAELGGHDTMVYNSTLVDSDSDGMPDSWETKMGLNPNNANDAGVIITDENSPYYGYSNIEVYINDIVGEWDSNFPITNTLTNPTLPTITIKELSSNKNIVLDNVNPATLKAGESYSVAFDSSNNISNIITYVNDQQVVDNSNFSIDKQGLYNLNFKAIATNGLEIFTEPQPIMVVSNNSIDKNLESFSSVDIGSPKIKGEISFDEINNTMTIEGSGLIGYTANTSTQGDDAFQYNYTKITGDAQMIAKVDNWAKIDYFQKAGLMLRADLGAKSEFYMSSFTYLKGENYAGVTDVSGGAIKAKNIITFARTASGNNLTTGNFLGIPLTRIDQPLNYGWVKITKKGQTVTTSASLDGAKWYELNKYTTTLPDTCYIGFAVEAVQDTCEFTRVNVAQFSNISLTTNSPTSLLGDVNCDGALTASDSSLLLQYILNSDAIVISPEGLLNAKVTKGEIYTAENCSVILQKVLNSDFKFPVE